MKDIIKQLSEEKDYKERAKILDKFRDYQSKKDNYDNLIEIYKEAISLLDLGNDKEKEISLRVIGNIYNLFPLPTLLSESDDSQSYLNYDDLYDLTFKLLELLINDNGNIRIAAANSINHIRGFIDNDSYVTLYFDLLSLKNNADKDKAKSIIFCLDKIFSPMLDMAIDMSYPEEVKRVKIGLVGNVSRNIKKIARDVEFNANKMIKETEKYIPQILAMRGKNLFEKNLIPYLENAGMFQILYELQKLNQLLKNNEISAEVLKYYLQTRIAYSLKSYIERIKMMQNKNEFEGVFLNLEKNELKLVTFDKIEKIFQNTLNEINLRNDRFILDI